MANVAINSPYMRAKQMAEAFNVTKSTIWNWTKNGIIPKPITIGRCTVWDTEEVFNTVKQHKEFENV